MSECIPDALVKGMTDALSHLDDIATSPCMMGSDDIESLSEAREILGELLGLTYNDETERFT